MKLCSLLRYLGDAVEESRLFDCVNVVCTHMQYMYNATYRDNVIYGIKI